MKQLKVSPRFSILLMAIAFIVTSCQKDDDNSLSLQQEQIKGHRNSHCKGSQTQIFQITASCPKS